MMTMRRTIVSATNRRLQSTSVAAAVSDTEWESARPYNEIPGPKRIPILGCKYLLLPGFRKYDFSNLTTMHSQLHNEFGNIVRFSGMEPRRDMVMVYDANDIETIFRTEGAWPERPSLGSMQYFRQVARKDFFKGVGGVLNDQGEPWQKIRTMVNPVMMQPKTAKQYAGKINEVSEEFVRKIPGFRDAKNELPAEFKNEMHKWALESIAAIALDTRLGCLDANLAPGSDPQRMIDSIHQLFADMHYLELKSFMWRIVPTPALRRFVKNSNVLLEISYKYVQEAMERYKNKPEGEEKGVLERFLEKDPDPTRAIIMALDMLFAGVDTTSHAVSNMLLHLSYNQDKQEILFREMKNFLPKVDTPLTYEMLDQMKYLRACIKESMRMQPVASGNARTTHSEMVLGGYRIPKNVDLVMSHGMLSIMDKHYPQPDKFIPERWIRGHEQEQRAHPFVTMPFGHGARKCVGMRFANMEMEMLLAKMIRRFEWDYKYGPMKYESSLITAPVGPLTFTVTDRT